MGLLNASNSERFLFNDMFRECLKLNGIPAKITLVKCYKKSYDSDHTPVYEDFVIETDILLNENPPIKSLKALGWFTLENDVKPAIAYFPTYFLSQRGTWEPFRPMLYTKVEIEYSAFPGQKNSRLFYVSKIPQGTGTNNMYWTVGLSPVLEFSNEAKEVKKGKSSTFLNIPKDFDL